MRIKHVKIHNWRSVGDIEICFEDLMIFIGQNNHGKSNILTALLFFLGQLNHSDIDFKDGSDELFVEVTFTGLDENDNTTFKKYLASDNTIKVRKSVAIGGGSEYHGYLESPEDDWLKEDKIADFTKRDVAELLPLSSHLPSGGRITKDIFKAAQEKFIQANRTSITFNYELESNNFLGTKNVASGIWGEIYFIPSIKKASDEFTARGNTVFNQLYSKVINAMSENSEEFQTAKEQLKALVGKLNKHTDDGNENTERPSELTDFEKVLESELQEWNAKIDVEITPPDIDDILKVGTNVWVDDGVRTDIARKGQGLQRALIFALIMSLAKVSQERKEDGTRKASQSAYFILEEPELFLHPQAQRALFDSLQLLSEDSQVILCTHSSSFLNLDKYKSICRVIKNDHEAGTEVCQCQNNLFSTMDDKKEFNLVYWINPDRSELFFAKKVILVEGPTDKTILPLLAKKLGIFRHDYTVIDCGSKSSIPQYINLLNYFSIPFVAVYDRDHQASKNAAARATADADSNAIESVISPSLGSSVIFENDIEEEIGMTEQSGRNKPYMALKYIEGDTFVLSDKLKAKIDIVFE